MILFKRMREKRINNILANIDKKNKLSRYIMLLSGCLIVAFAVHMFFMR